MKRSSFTAIAILSVCLFASFSAHAFCVYNKTSRKIHVSQPSNLKGFNKYIAGGGKECCNWREKTCNSEGKQTSMLTLDSSVRYYPYDGGSDAGFVNCGVHTNYGVVETNEVKLEAGGWLVYEHNPGYREPSYLKGAKNSSYIYNKVMSDTAPSSRVYRVSSYLHDGRPYAHYYCPGLSKK
jgi:hypothetical protein